VRSFARRRPRKWVCQQLPQTNLDSAQKSPTRAAGPEQGWQETGGLGAESRRGLGAGGQRTGPQKPRRRRGSRAAREKRGGE